MKWFFESLEKQNDLLCEMESWVNTPFRHGCGVKGVGCDCVHFVTATLHSVGAIPRKYLKLQRYPHDWCHHTDEQKLRGGLSKLSNMVELSLSSSRMNGDLVLYQFGRAASHIGIYFDAKVYQSVSGSGVEKVSYNDNVWRKRARFVFRVSDGKSN